MTRLLFEKLKIKLFEKYFKFARKIVCSCKGNKDVFNSSESIVQSTETGKLDQKAVEIKNKNIKVHAFNSTKSSRASFYPYYL